MMDGPKTAMLKEAVNAVLSSFAKHTKGCREVDVITTLQEFWHMKSAIHSNEPDKMEILYEHEANGQAPYVCYVTLPTGSCFGSFQYCLTKAEAQRSAAKIALMNSVFNEHPSRLITDAFIEQAVIEAKSNSGREDINGIEAFKYMLCKAKGKSMLEFQAVMTMFQLLNWSDSLKKLQDKGLSRNEVVKHYSQKMLDSEIRNEIARNWAMKTRNRPGELMSELVKAKAELEEFRMAGRELRFFKEKQDILTLAMKNSSRV